MRARRVRARVEGTVQGVGFRPFVYGLATELDLGGFVLNDARGVAVEVEGRRSASSAFSPGCRREAPPLAAIERVDTVEAEATGERASRSPAASTAAARRRSCRPACRATPVIAATVHQLHQLRSALRRSRATTAGDDDGRFEMCAACRGYADPRDRRCPTRAQSAGPGSASSTSPSRRRGRRCGRGHGRGARRRPHRRAKVGGYHLARRATPARCRRARNREDRPFARGPDLATARRLVELTPAEQERRAERPIVIVGGAATRRSPRRSRRAHASSG